MTEGLYRKEALRARGRALQGRVVLSHGMMGWGVVLALLIGLCLTGAWLLTRTIDGTPLWQWIGAQF